MKGKCLCGQVEFELINKVSNIYQCHCSLCRKATGTSFCSAIVVGLNDLRWTKGKDNIGSYTKENGFRSDFCKNCGSPVPNKMNIGDYIWVPAGLLEGPIDSRVVAHIHTDSRATWDVASNDSIIFSRNPDDIDEFMRMLNDG